MKAAVAIKSMVNNPYFARRAAELFDEVHYMENRPSAEELARWIDRVDVLIIGAREKINAEMVQSEARKVRVIGTLSLGTDHLDLDALADQGIELVSCCTANVRSVAEHVIAATFALSKRFKEADRVVQSGGWREGLPEFPIEIMGKTIGLIGYGKIGREVALLARALGMRVIATTANRTHGIEDEVEFVPLTILFQQANVISVSVPLTEKTRNLVSSDLIESVRPGTLLINTSRSATIDELAVKEAVISGRLGGYAGDADADTHGLSALGRVVMTPHIAGATIESYDRLDDELIDRLWALLNHG